MRIRLAATQLRYCTIALAQQKTVLTGFAMGLQSGDYWSGRVALPCALRGHPAQTPRWILSLWLCAITFCSHVSMLRNLVGAGTLMVDFEPPTNGPIELAPELKGWKELPDFHTQSALVYHLLGSFMAQERFFVQFCPLQFAGLS